MQNKFEDFLKKENTVSEVFNGRYNKMNVMKEKYNDRFIVLYTKLYKDSLGQEDYSIAGYYDVKDNKIYNISSYLEDIVPIDSKIKFDNFNSLGKQIFSEIDNYIKEYMNDNAEELKEKAIEKYNHEDNWRTKNYKQEVEKIFITKTVPEIEFNNSSCQYYLSREGFYYDKTIFQEYLENPDNAIEKYSKIFIEKDELDIGLSLLLYETKQEYLSQIIENKNNNFDNLYLNKKMYDCIKEQYVRTINITIKYDDNELTFKYNHESLMNDLSNSNLKSHSYWSGYNIVRNFFSNNDIRNEYGQIETDFSFKNITLITHGKEILYQNDNVIKELEQEEDLDLER